MIRQCLRCEQYFGTAAGWHNHNGKRGCKKPHSLNKEGMWQGFMGVWWTKDLGWDDEPQDWDFQDCDNYPGNDTDGNLLQHW